MSGPVRAGRAAGDLAFDLAGARCVATCEGGLFLPDGAVLVVADLHFEKGSHFAARGLPLPPFDSMETLARLRRLAGRLEARTIVALGDSFHDRDAGARMAPPVREGLVALAADFDCVWIAGNHDPETPHWLAGARAEEIRLGPLVLRHEPGGPLVHGEAEVAGHLHPCVKVAGSSGRRVRRPCFAVDSRRLVLPSFGAFTGGLNVCDPAFAPVFPDSVQALALGRGAVHRIAAAHFLPDGRQAPGRASPLSPRGEGRRIGGKASG